MSQIQQFTLEKVNGNASLEIVNSKGKSFTFEFACLELPKIDFGNNSVEQPGAVELRSFLRNSLSDPFTINLFDGNSLLSSTGSQNKSTSSNSKSKIVLQGALIIDDKNLGLTLIERGLAKVKEQGPNSSLKELWRIYDTHLKKILKNGQTIPKYAPRKFRFHKESFNLREEHSLIGLKLTGIVENIINSTLYEVYIPASNPSPNEEGQLLRENKVFTVTPAYIEPSLHGLELNDVIQEMLRKNLLGENVTLKILGFKSTNSGERVAQCFITINDMPNAGDLNKKLISQGFASIMDEAYLNLEPEDYEEYFKLENKARENRLGIWKQYLDFFTISNRKKEHSGHICEVISGSIVKIFLPATGEILKWKISFIMAPMKTQYYGFEAREFIRKNFISNFS
jgi:endonuclease YncB( thermonuclease family)